MATFQDRLDHSIPRHLDPAMGPVGVVSTSPEERHQQARAASLVIMLPSAPCAGLATAGDPYYTTDSPAVREWLASVPPQPDIWSHPDFRAVAEGPGTYRIWTTAEPPTNILTAEQARRAVAA